MQVRNWFGVASELELTYFLTFFRSFCLNLSFFSVAVRFFLLISLQVHFFCLPLQRTFDMRDFQ